MGVARQRAIHYWHPGRREWTSDPDGCQRRAVATVSVRSEVMSETVIEELVPGGSWAPSDESALAGPERGLCWRGWPASVMGTPLVMILGVRAIDRALAERLMDGLSPYAHSGERLNDHRECGVRFALSPEDARVFARRVSEIGGTFGRGEPEFSDLERHARTISGSLTELRAIAARATGLLDDADDALRMDDLRALGAQAWRSYEAARRAITNIEAGVREHGEAGAGVDERVEAQRLLDDARFAMEQARHEFMVYRACEDEAVRALARLARDDDLHGVSGMEGGDDEVLLQLWARLKGAGMSAHMEQRRIVVDVGAGQVLIGTDQVSVRRREA